MDKQNCINQHNNHTDINKTEDSVSNKGYSPPKTEIVELASKRIMGGGAFVSETCNGLIS